RAQQHADAQGRRSLHRTARPARRGRPERARSGRELRPRPRARLRRPDQQHRGRRHRRYLRRRPALRPACGGYSMTVNDASAEAAPGQQTSIGLVGLGNMGAVMSARLVAAGFTVHGHDISARARAALADAGGLAHDNLGDAVRDASVVILMLPSSDAVEGVVRDPPFTLAAGPPVIDMGSSEPARTQALAAELGQREITLVDAPVSGGVAGSRAGRLTIMVGADAAVLDRLRPVFEP